MEVEKSDSDRSEQSISECFNEAVKTFEEICNCDLATNSSEVQYKVKKCMNLLEDVTKMVSYAGMFSSNESIEEVPTSNVKFLLLPVLLGTLTLKLTSGDRLEIVNTAEMYFRDFLQRCKDYGIKPDLEIPPMENIEEGGSSDGANASFSPRNVDMLAMARRRAFKIQQFREQKELESQMALLKQEFESDRIDEEIQRKYYLSFINCYINKALDDLDCLMSEKSLLTRVNKEKPFGAPVWDDELERSRNKSHRSKPLQPILITKDDFQKKVFGYGYPSLPVMTVKELYEQRMRDGTWAAPSTANPSSVQEFSNSEIKLLEEAEQEEQQVEQDDPEYLDRKRNMDEYKDTHSRGWGNRYNRS